MKRVVGWTWWSRAAVGRSGRGGRRRRRRRRWRRNVGRRGLAARAVAVDFGAQIGHHLDASTAVERRVVAERGRGADQQVLAARGHGADHRHLAGQPVERLVTGGHRVARLGGRLAHAVPHVHQQPERGQRHAADGFQRFPGGRGHLRPEPHQLGRALAELRPDGVRRFVRPRCVGVRGLCVRGRRLRGLGVRGGRR